MASLDVTLRTYEGDPAIQIVELSGVLEGTTIGKLDVLDDVARRGTRKVLLDMTKIRYANSPGFGALMKFNDKFRGLGGGMALVRLPPKVKITMDLLGLDKFLDICADEKAAVEALSRRPGSGAPAAAPSSPPPSTPAPMSAPPAPSTHDSGTFAQPSRMDLSGSMRAQPQAAAPGAPIPCGTCGIPVELPGAGNWKCPRCGTIIALTADGRTKFQAPDRLPPYELSISCSREATEGLKLFVGAVAQPILAPQTLEALKASVGEVASVIASTAYNYDPKASYQVLVETTASDVRIKIADHGRTLDSTRIESFFPTAVRSMSEFECRPHPKGGNVIRMVRKRG